MLRPALSAATAAGAPPPRIVGVAIHTDIEDGLSYLRGFGEGAFDEISVGRGWQNEIVTQRVWRTIGGDPSAPQVIVISRRMHATLDPIELTFADDSVHRVVVGYQELLAWVRIGAPLATGDPPRPRP